MNDGLSRVFDELTHIKFTTAGKVQLSGFSDEAIRYADEAVGGRDLLGNPFPYFYSICKKYALEHFEEPDSQVVAVLARQHNVSYEDEKIDAFTPHAKVEGPLKKEATPWPELHRPEDVKKNCYKPLKGNEARRHVATIKDGMLKGVCPVDELLTYIKKQREYFDDDTEGLFDLYKEMKDATPSEIAPISKEIIQKLLPF